MDRLTTGRRHVRAGSVSVTELITKQAARSESPAPERDGPATTTGLPVVIEAGPTSHRREYSRGVQLAKITSLGVATIALCGAVGVASTIAHQRAAETDVATQRPAAHISGEQALLPDELNRSLNHDGASAVPPPRPEPVTNGQRAAAPVPSTAPATSTATPAPDSPAAAATEPSLDTDLAVVRRFYEVVPSDPAVAFGLISPDLLHSTLGQFLQSWSRVDSVDVLGLRQRADGVLAVVRMRLADGGHLQLQQLLTVADTPPRIVGVELLSAQRN